MNTKIIVGVIFPYRLDTLKSELDTIIYIERQDIVNDAGNLLFLHWQSADGCIHIHRGAFTDAKHGRDQQTAFEVRGDR